MKQQPPQALLMQAVALHQQGQLDQAKALYEKVLAKQPKNFDALHLSGMLAGQSQNFVLASERISQAITVNSKHAGAYNNLGNVLHALKHWDEALSNYGKAINLQPRFAEAYYNRGKLLRDLKRFNEALKSYAQAITIKPGYAEAYIGCGNVQKELGRFDEALKNYKEAIVIKPDYAEAHNNAGIVLQELCRYDEALASYRRAITIKPDYANAYNNSGNLLKDMSQLDEALVNYERAFNINPNYEFHTGILVQLRNQMSLWNSYDQDNQYLKAQLQNAQRASPPLTVLALFDDPSIQRAAAEVWAQTHESSASPLGAISLSSSPHPRKIRLAYYSADFHNHATAYLMAQLFECHDRERFELFAFSFGTDSANPMRQRLVAAFDHFIDVRHETDQAVAQRSRDLGIDIAVDLKGYTRDSRPGIFAHRCAPVQVNYLGYPGTMGAPFMDYLIADKVVIPPESQQHYLEKIVYLPHSYQVNDGHREIASTVWRKADLGLPEEGFVFCCFNNSYKITPSTFASWMRILQAVPASVMWLLGDNATAQRNLQSHAQAAGVDPSRLVFGLRVPTPEHLARHKAADLFLDTLPCNAHTTASDALWAGLPVLTQQGQSFAARVAASLLHAVGLPELIVHTAQEYEELAMALAKDSERLNHIKAKLAAQRDTAPLFNTKQLARDIEQAYQTMHERAQEGLAAQGFEVV